MRLRRVAAAAAWTGLVSALLQGCISERVQGLPDLEGDCSVPMGAFGRDHRLVIIRDFAFLPDSVRIAPGASVTWANCEPDGTEGHTIAGPGGTFSSSLLPAGARFTHRFESAGTFEYTCGPHPHMRAVIIVE